MVSELNHLSSIANSDHLLISFNFICDTASELEGSQKVKYNYHYHYQSIIADLSKIDWDEKLPGLLGQDSLKYISK